MANKVIPTNSLVNFFVNNKGIAELQLNRPDKHNALSMDMIETILNLLSGNIINNDVKVLILSGVGKSFCAGADLSEITINPSYTSLLQEMVAVLEKVEVPVIAALSGAVIGAGVQLALAADLRVMDKHSYIYIPAAKIGIAIDTWSIKKLELLIGRGAASSILYACDKFSAEKCLHFGFANEIGSKINAETLANKLAESSSQTLAHYKIVLNDDATRTAESPKHHLAQFKIWAGHFNQV